MKKLRFSTELIEKILSGKKTTTWRVDDDKDIRAGDELSLCNAGNVEFATAKVISVKETTFGKLTNEDRKGHETFKSDEEMYRTYSRYYKIRITPDTKLKVIKFILIK
jgi:hypothetical protein